MDLLVRSSGQDGIFIGGWLVGGGGLLVGHGKGLLLGGVCEWHYGGAICDLQWKQVGKGDNSDLYLLCNFAKIFMDN